ncbi:MAG: hypothetical protein C5B51_00180 [Terriglobia bacterium]|nr:MAG: hypothetical protein C5B51_00180 [Terriglobia bacterium]
MNGHGSKFSRKMEDAIAALLIHRNHEEAARAVGIGTTTLLRWQKEPEFQKAFREARREAFGQTIARLQQMSGAAATTLGKVMVDPTAPASTRVRAAEAIINHAAKAIEIEDIEARVAELERAAEMQKRK